MEEEWLKLEQLTESVSASILKASRAIAAQEGSLCYLPGTVRLRLSVHARYRDGLELRFPESCSGPAGDADGESAALPLSRLSLTFHSNLAPAKALEA